ncbi:unnamed protein product [Ostreobium quekettii]|uniref:Protein arginine methyltransferase NDUFAF7 n=1 Tax=Ostreobium quekettii TaxID=121088 RepID=A0A8S1IM16_9CHLO|nr:unnamed protein product [Ostreobium quekettii]|eukprot:evm.model.scf_446EXC.1 EVM.evm.TU.scf_446EXC.1   scf_446EXC:2048-7195(+)
MGGGPISVATYMKEVLTNPTHGFYMNRDVLGSSGDFVTSPEISQVFGELIGIWTMLAWEQMGCPRDLRIVELGPGRGTLMADLLRGTAGFSKFASSLRGIHLVEISKALRALQEAALRARPGLVGEGRPQVCWHTSLREVPKDGRLVIIAHEFLDALPVHQFVKTDKGWREKMIDVAEPHDPLHFRFVLAANATPAVALLANKRLEWMEQTEQEKLKELEASAHTLALVVEVAERVAEQKGVALIVDYGRDGPYEMSLRGIRDHRVVNVLESPGTADLSAHVDFSALKRAVEESGKDAIVHGPISQGHFLKAMGLEARLETLLQAATPAQAAALRSGCERLVGGSEDARQEEGVEGMGEVYKVMAVTPREVAEPIPF